MCINTNGVESSCLHLLTESIFNINNLTVDSNK